MGWGVGVVWGRARACLVQWRVVVVAVGSTFLQASAYLPHAGPWSPQSLPGLQPFRQGPVYCYKKLSRTKFTRQTTHHTVRDAGPLPRSQEVSQEEPRTGLHTPKS